MTFSTILFNFGGLKSENSEMKLRGKNYFRDKKIRRFQENYRPIHLINIHANILNKVLEN